MSVVPFVTHKSIIQGPDITYKIAADDTSRGMFQTYGVLDDLEDTNFRAISDAFPVFAISKDLGTIQATQLPFVWTIGFTMDPAINYTDGYGTPTQRTLYYKSQYSDDDALVSAELCWEMMCSAFTYTVDRRFLEQFFQCVLERPTAGQKNTPGRRVCF
jgi:hypothetical protein